MRRMLSTFILLAMACTGVFWVSAQTEQASCGSEYVVQPGDNLTIIAARCNTTIEQLRADNEVFSLIRRGQVLVISTPIPAATATPTVAMPTVVMEEADINDFIVIAVFPVVTAPDTVVNVVANGLPESSEVAVLLDNGGATMLSETRAFTDASGSLSAAVIIPTDTLIGSVLGVLIETEDGELLTAPAMVTIVSRTNAVGGAGVAPTATLIPTAAAVGGAVDPSLGAGGDTEAQIVITATATSTPAPTTIPTALPTAIPTPSALAAGSAANLPLIPASSGANADGVLFDRVNIYMAATDSASGTNITTVCGDSLVPVQLGIPATVGPLTAAIRLLLDNSAADFGLDAAVVNPLAEQNLTLESVLVINSEALISFSGTVTAGDACANALVRAQLEATALQYNTVNRVSVFVDGVPLSTLLP